MSDGDDPPPHAEGAAVGGAMLGWLVGVPFGFVAATAVATAAGLSADMPLEGLRNGLYCGAVGGGFTLPMGLCSGLWAAEVRAKRATVSGPFRTPFRAAFSGAAFTGWLLTSAPLTALWAVGLRIG
ncbi:hypothetical protein [Alienimonas chondri]|uniref:Uncharacterized protein n=1 Tax=Alienimonas chondri TaxID=2681879 RepID=A0ABX1VB42_9PLAN|nr:hypothetical protein [Alienimonas chondri]NNJ25155.1 hypothetical protein [Alienimonas chondri]